MILKLLYVIYLKSAKITLSVLLRLVNLFAMSMVESLSVLSLCMFKTVRLLNCSWFILERSHVFSLWAVEKDLSPAALVARFTRITLHNVITSFIISRSGLGQGTPKRHYWLLFSLKCLLMSKVLVWISLHSTSGY